MELFKKKEKQAAEPQAPVAVQEPPKKKNPAAMDVKELFTFKKVQVETTPVDDLAIIPDAPQKAPKEKKKSLATMDMKDLFKSKKAKAEAAPVDDLTVISEPSKQDPNAPKEKKQSLATMDIKDLVQLLKNRPAKTGNIDVKKRTMNFVHHKSNFNVVKMLPVMLVLIIAAATFVKVGFLDQMDKKTRAYSDLAAQQEKLAMVNARLSDYDELIEEYGRYSYGWMTETEISLVNRIDILELVEKRITPYATAENISINNNVLTMNLHGITLEETSKMVRRLEKSDMVQTATVYSASAANDGEASIFISITLVKPVETVEGSDYE